MTYKVIFLGTPEFAVSHLRALHEMQDVEVVGVFSQPPRPVGRKKVIEKSPIQKESEKLGLNVYTPKKFSTTETKVLLEGLNIDLAVVSAFGEIISEEILNIPKLGFVNVHASLLPKYRGASPIQSAIFNGEIKTGVTLQKVVYKLDSGPIYASKETEINVKDTTESLTKKLSDLGIEMINKVIPKVLKQELESVPQKEVEATHCKKIKKEDGEIRAEEENIESIVNKVRAFIPWPKAFFVLDLNGKKLKVQVLEAEVSLEKLSGQKPCAIIETDKKEPALVCKDGFLVLNKVKPEGKNEMNGKDFWRGYKSV